MKIFKVLFALLAFALVACEEPDYGTTPDTTVASLGTPENNEIWFTTTDGKVLLNLDETAFNVAVAEVIYSEYDINVIRFAGEVTTIGEGAFEECTNIFNLSLILGVASQITPLTSSGIGPIDYGVMILAGVLPFVLAFRGKLNRWAGAIMFVCFIAYNYYLIVNAGQ